MFLLTFPLAGAVTDLSLVGATSTQIVISYTAPTNAACTVEASRSSDFSTLALDVDPASYPGSDSDLRAGNIRYGRYRIVVIGKQGPAAIEQAKDGFHRSRALRADTGYFIRVNCAGDSATTQARTANILLGDSRGEALAVAAPFQYSQVSQNPVAVKEYTDPYTGALIKNHAPLLGYYYAASTADSGWMTSGSDCNKTLSGVKGSCRFTDAAGTGWSANSGTLTDAVRADDSNYAEYSGTTQQPLFVRLGTGKVPDNTSLGELFSWQNLIIRGLTTDASGGGGEVEVCWTRDGEMGQCDSPWRTVTLTASDATYRVCHDSPCTNAETAGDFGTYKDPSRTNKFGRSRVYNVAGSLTTIRFTGTDAAADCNRLYVGEAINAQNTLIHGEARTVYTLTINAKSCGSSPPQVTVNESVDLTHNGTTGVGFFTFDGIGSHHYGVLIRKKSTTSGSTIRIGYLLWRAAWSNDTAFNFASGGFGKKCQTVPTAGGYYLCITSNPGSIIGIKPSADGLDVKNYGVPAYRGDVLIGSSMKAQWTTCTVGGNSMLWDDATPGRFYCGMPTAYPNPAKGGAVDNRLGIVMIDMALTERALGDPDGAPTGANSGLTAVSAATLLTPCLNSCTATTDDYTPIAQVQRNFANFDNTRFPSCSLGESMGDSIFFTCSAGIQNSTAWFFAFDLGNRLPIGSGYSGSHGAEQIFAGTSSSSPPMSRWCSFHTGQSPAVAGGGNYLIPEVSAGSCYMSVQLTSNLSACTANANPGTCNACPDVTLDGFNYNGKNWCSSITTTSSWNGAWGSTPSGWQVGDPVQSGCAVSPNLYYDQRLQVGDYISHGGELMRIIAKASNTSYTVVRGFGSWYDAGKAAKVHTSGDSLTAICYSLPGDPTKDNTDTERGSMVWHFLNDSTGQDTDYTFLTKFHNHAFTFNDGTYNYGVVTASPVVSNGLLIGKWQTPAELKAFFSNHGHGTNGAESDIGWAEQFAGKASGCYGNACEFHPGAQHVLGDALTKTWFHDVRPRLFHRGSLSIALLSGTSNIFQVTPLAEGAYIHPKHYDQEVFTSRFPYQRVDTLTDDAAGRGKWCYAVKANDCFSGTTAGKIYFSSDIHDTTWNSLGGCRESLFQTVQVDFCAGNSAGHSSSVVQVKFPESNGLVVRNGAYVRAVSREGLTYHASATSNVHSDPSGAVLLNRTYNYIVPPRFPGLDTRNRGTFVGIPVTIPGVPVGTDNALVQFGYNESFQCSRNRDNTCYAESATLNQNNPYQFDHETLTGVPCASGCTVTIPAIANRVLYWRAVYRDAGGGILGYGVTNLQATQ